MLGARSPFPVGDGVLSHVEAKTLPPSSKFVDTPFGRVYCVEPARVFPIPCGGLGELWLERRFCSVRSRGVGGGLPVLDGAHVGVQVRVILE